MDSIFITGAAAGIGRATAQLFARKGWFVGLADRDADGLAQLHGQLGKRRSSMHVVDVTDFESVATALAEFGEHTGGRLRVLHNNAGVLKVGPFEELSPQDHRRTIDINVTGVINVLYASFPYLQRTPNAQVVNMSSVSALYGIPDFSSYSASKHAVRALTEALDIEWERHGIRVTDLMPPFVNTGMVQSQAGASKIIDRLGVNVDPEDVAADVWALVGNPALHRPVTRSLRAIWPLVRAAPAGVKREFLRRIAGM